MANDRLKLHELLVKIPGVKKVYFQPPDTVVMEYPAIVYALSALDPVYADDKKYFNKTKYSITVIDRNPDTEIYHKILELRYSAFNTHFVSANLNHYVCSLYY